jgi:NAD(P)-dependent dehydrogenase (short-subunit alcohol dehydrogenase family)
MPKPVSEQVVVVVGASGGIGRASALKFARGGAKVVCAAQNGDALDGLVQEITTSGGTAVAIPTDVADPEAVRDLAAGARKHFGGVDTWVNAAAVGVWGRVEDISDEEFDRVMRVNFLGHVHAVHAVLPLMRAGGGGVIIGISSVEGVRSVPLHAPYTASKWALRAFYDSLRVELAQDGAPIAITTILPASIDTPFFENSRSKVASMPKPPPPVYAPELVAEAVVRASEHPRREIPVGGAALAFFIGQRLSPALTDAVLSIPRLGAGTQQSDRPDNGVDNLDAPVAGTGRVHGAHSGRVLTRSPVTWLAARWLGPGELLTTAVSRLQSRRAGARRPSSRTRFWGRTRRRKVTPPTRPSPGPEFTRVSGCASCSSGTR